MTDKALENAERNRDSLAAEINFLAQRTEELKRDIAKINDWISRWHEFTGKDEAATPAPESNEPAPSVTRSAKLRRAMVRPGRERLSGIVEVDEQRKKARLDGSRRTKP